ncbi:MAG: trypsin-like serine protease [Chloroflexota bacterium]
MKRFLQIMFVFTLVMALSISTANVSARETTTGGFDSLQKYPHPETFSPDGKTVTITATKAESQATVKYWTKNRLEAAKPLPFPSDIAASVSTEISLEGQGIPEFTSGILPNPAANQFAKKTYPAAWKDTKDTFNFPMTFDDYGTKAVFTGYYTNYYANMWKYYPYATVGRLYITGGGYCTAAVISSYTIVTAAHCVYDTVHNKWMTGWAFVPAYRNGMGPYGVFGWYNAKVLTSWMSASGTLIKADVAVIQLQTDSYGYEVADYTGSLGRSQNFSAIQNVTTEGYPSNLASGVYSYTCAAETFVGGVDILGMGCNMTFGSSGGPWIKNFAPNSGGYVNSVVSGGTVGTYTFYGPRFTSSNIGVLCTSFCY